MKTLVIGLLLSLPALAAVTNIHLNGATATQAVLDFDVPDPTSCTVQVSTDPAFGTLVNDTNTSLFSGSQNCNRSGSTVNGNHVTFVIGVRTSQQGTDGRFYSRALAAGITHYFRIYSQSDAAVVCDLNSCFATKNPPFGNTFPEPPP